MARPRAVTAAPGPFTLGVSLAAPRSGSPWPILVTPTARRLRLKRRGGGPGGGPLTGPA
jgi:hypothetical protein